MYNGNLHAEGDTLMTAIEVAALPKIAWSPVSEAEEAQRVAQVSSADSVSDWLFQLAHPVIEAMLNLERSAHATFDWCTALSPVLSKSVECTSAKYCNLESVANKVMGYLKLGSLPYELPKLFDVFVASGKAYADNPRITKIVTPKCSAKTSLPVAADVSASGLQVVLQIDIRVHVCVLWFICHDLHPTTFATITLPGTFSARVTQPDGLLSLRVEQAITEFAVDAKWDEETMLLSAATRMTDSDNPTADALEKCAKTLSKANATACDSLAVKLAHENLALELSTGNLGTGIRSSIMDFVGLQIDGAGLPNAQISISSGSDDAEFVI
eukprot:TRINITY_DN18364_c0_g1_i1.p1 TRINITY_DN18364_c0_g1~~TRINITY_DN18364_c0_g1_i1.p1  ORF type:complete len:327 (+),score=97.04 TRINITY_DN18364_c0_g1_i1:461-1441(+)